MSCLNCSTILNRINPIYEMIYEIRKPYNVSRNGWFDLEFDTITVTNPNGTISVYPNSYPFLLQQGTFSITKENFGHHDSVMIGIRYDTIHTIGEGTMYSSNSYFFFRIATHPNNDNEWPGSAFLTLNCSDAKPCTIIVRKM